MRKLLWATTEQKHFLGARTIRKSNYRNKDYKNFGLFHVGGGKWGSGDTNSLFTHFFHATVIILTVEGRTSVKSRFTGFPIA